MASKSRAAQERLAELEKDSASFEDQLLEASKFIGIDLEDVGTSIIENLDLDEGYRGALYHGREEWLLRWLLKKLQAPRGDVPRKTPNSWILLSYLIRIIPLSNAARMLSEKKLMGILRQTLEEAQKLASKGSDINSTSKSNLGEEHKTSKTSKKRKRSGEFIANGTGSENHSLHTAIFTTVYHTVRFTKVKSEASEGGRTAAFLAEYMKSVIKAPAEDAAKILGSWLSLCQISSQGFHISDIGNMKFWLSPFIAIWDSRILGNEDVGQFSLYCSQPLLALLKAVNAWDALVDWKDELEQLVARNIMIPAKTDRMENLESELLNTLTRISVIQDSANAAILFEVAIRSIQTQGPQRRRANDSWLQPVFTTLRAAMPTKRIDGNGKAIQQMLQSAIKYNIDLGLPTLRSVTSEYGMLERSTNWDLLGTIIALDANVFLISNDKKDLLQELLTRITAACVEPTWAELSVKVICGVLVPLMNGFAKARDLSAFIHHWYAELVNFEKLRKEARLFSMAIFSAWEDESLQMEFSKIMEPSLTVAQINQLLEWLSTQVSNNPDAVCVLLEAMAGSITQVETSDAVGLRLYDIMFGDAASGKLDGRYRWRSWRILSRTLNWPSPIETDLEDFSGLWEEHAPPFDSLSSRFAKDSLLDVVNGNTVELETIEAVRFICTAWNVSTRNGRLRKLCKKPVLEILQALAQDIKLFPRDLMSDQELGDERCSSTLGTLYRGIGWMLSSCVRCVFVDCPQVLELGFEMEGDLFKELLQTVFWIASVSPPDPSSKDLNAWLRTNHDVFPSIWTSILSNDNVLNNKPLVGLIIETMLCSETNIKKPLLESATQSTFAVKCLLDIPLEVYLRKYRENIMKSWLLKTGHLASDDFSDSATLHPSVLSLKVKIMQRPTVYEGMKYQDLVTLADSLASAKIEDLDVSLALFKELLRRTMSHITSNLDQTRNREYALDALKHLRKKTKPKSDDKKVHKLDYALVSLLEVLIEVLATKGAQLNDLDIISKTGFATLKESFKNRLLVQLEDLLARTESKKPDKEVEKFLTLLATIDSLSKLEVDRSELINVADAAKSFTASLDKANAEVAKRLDTFMSTHLRSAELKVTFRGDLSTVYDRQAIQETVKTLATGKGQHQKLKLLKFILEDNAAGLLQLDSVLTVRHIIMACEDTRSSTNEDDEDDSFDLSTLYSILCSHLWKATSIRQFSLISETMALMLRSKNRAMNQWNIDSTLGSITIMCSRNAPRLRPTRAGTIYKHLCKLLQTLLTSHRLKLQGHFHLIVQAMQGLLRCLFTPLPRSTSKASKLFAPPPWLSSSKHQLNVIHAASFTRLVTLICDPSVSSVTRSKQNNLTSATAKAKRMAGQHMQFVLTLYVQLQLEMKMLPEIREKMVPALYAIFDTTTPEIRRMIGDSLDSSGRSVFGTLFRDYQRFGRWKGS